MVEFFLFCRTWKMENVVKYAQVGDAHENIVMGNWIIGVIRRWLEAIKHDVHDTDIMYCMVIFNKGWVRPHHPLKKPPTTRKTRKTVLRYRIKPNHKTIASNRFFNDLVVFITFITTLPYPTFDQSVNEKHLLIRI